MYDIRELTTLPSIILHYGILSLDCAAALRVMSLGESLSDAVKAKRVHHQLTPNELGVECEWPAVEAPVLMTLYNNYYPSERNTTFTLLLNFILLYR